jgi:hypothetical protein
MRQSQLYPLLEPTKLLRLVSAHAIPSTGEAGDVAAGYLMLHNAESIVEQHNLSMNASLADRYRATPFPG